MKKPILILIVLCQVVASYAQGLMELPLPEYDSTEVNIAPKESRPICHQDILSNLLLDKNLIPQKLNLPEFNFDNIYSNKWQIDNSGFFNSGYQFNQPWHLALNSPFIRSGTIFNQASYKITDKFILGGNSFGGNSIFSAPIPNRGNYNFRGASMFMQYKVSKNFKIETRVSVTNSPHQHP